MTPATAERFFSWDATYQVSPRFTSHADGCRGMCIVYPAHVIECRDEQIRIGPPESVALDCGNPDLWDIYSHSGLVLSAEHMKVVLACLRPTTPRQICATPGALGHDEASRLIAALVFKRILLRCPGESPGRCDSPATRGVLVIGFGTKYVRLASILAQSIKASAPRLPIALLHDREEAHVVEQSEGGRQLFDRKLPHSRADFVDGGVWSPFLMKLHADVLTPFQETIFVDADSIMFPHVDLSAAFERYGASCFAPTCSGAFESSMDRVRLCLGDVRHVAAHFGLDGIVYRVHSYFMYFRTCEDTARLFAAARELFAIAARSRTFVRYRGLIPDEPVLSAATAVTKPKIQTAYNPTLAESVFVGTERLDADWIRTAFWGMTMTATRPRTADVDSYNRIAHRLTLGQLDRQGGEWQGK
jgi:hypothetical protein